ncbi:glycosyltransferase [Rhodococcus qingshengii]|uniref:Glycosyltransferase n=1 Tax=Rhodococcus qingshengii TaxID=334542 RepID=A0AAW6LD38_RHOSG|nr:glycosyltransferase [Rhodococcus qingshengii]MDE8644869.1 glycosyltransferase [Rhodococcus qingshengii]
MSHIESDIAYIENCSEPEHLASRFYPTGFEENDKFRSHFIRNIMLQQLGRKQDSSENSRTGGQIPKTLVQFWDDPQGPPIDVRKCLQSWNLLRDEGFEFQMFDDTSAEAFIAENYGPRERAAFKRCRHPAMRSDFLRVAFVLAKGGLYVDADDVLVGDGWKEVFRNGALKIQPLCYDVLANGMASASDLRDTHLPTEGRIFYVNNNPIAAPAGHPVLERALARATDILLGTELAPEIQSTTGPGNLTIALAAHANQAQIHDLPSGIEFLFDWEETAEPCWELAYRRDARNWRNMSR